jgi:hypothetical protein
MKDESIHAAAKRRTSQFACRRSPLTPGPSPARGEGRKIGAIQAPRGATVCLPSARAGGKRSSLSRLSSPDRWRQIRAHGVAPRGALGRIQITIPLAHASGKKTAAPFWG